MGELGLQIFDCRLPIEDRGANEEAESIDIRLEMSDCRFMSGVVAI
jgi:hypothetical protein